MKKVFMIFAMMIAFVTFASAQKEISLSSSDKEYIKGGINKALNEQISCFGGKMDLNATTIDQVYKYPNSELYIEGSVKYYTNTCGNVDTEYYAYVTKEGSQTIVKPCIYTPYCVHIFGWYMKTGQNWDCGCQKYQIPPGEVFKFAVDIVIDKYLSR